MSTNESLPQKHGHDVSDWFNAGHTVDELHQIVNVASLWKPNNVLSIKSNSSEFNFTPIHSLINEPVEQTSFIWEGTLPTGGFSICSSKPKVGKSTFARNLALAIARGEPFLGRATVKGRVLYLCLEEKRAEVANHFRRMGAFDDEILVAFVTPENALAALQVAIAEYQPVAVVIDPLSRILRVRDFNDYGTMARGLEPFIDLARRMNTHILALHHDSKGDRSGGDALLGSTALFGAVDCHIQMKRRERGRTILTTQRYGEDLPETVIELDAETGLITAQGDLQTLFLVEKQHEILEIMGEEELTEADIKDRIGGGAQGFGIVSKALRALCDDGNLVRTGKGTRGKPFVYRKASPENLVNPKI